MYGAVRCNRPADNLYPYFLKLVLEFCSDYRGICSVFGLNIDRVTNTAENLSVVEGAIGETDDVSLKLFVITERYDYERPDILELLVELYKGLYLEIPLSIKCARLTLEYRALVPALLSEREDFRS